jgi:hypothetical protein
LFDDGGVVDIAIVVVLVTVTLRLRFEMAAYKVPPVVGVGPIEVHARKDEEPTCGVASE